MVAAYHQRRSQTVACECGCGTTFDNWRRNGKRPRFVNGHNAKIYQSLEEATEARKQRVKIWKGENPEAIRGFKTKHYHTKKLKAMAMLGNACYFCGVPYDGKNAPIFEFHHRDPNEKDDGISKMLTSKSWSVVKAELMKCVLTCANCHNLHHGGTW
jgi:hypothetical protein